MTSTIFEPTEAEIRAINELQERIVTFLDQNPHGRQILSEALELPQRDVDRLLRRKDWTLSGALRIATILGVKFDMRIS